MFIIIFKIFIIVLNLFNICIIFNNMRKELIRSKRKEKEDSLETFINCYLSKHSKLIHYRNIKTNFEENGNFSYLVELIYEGFDCDGNPTVFFNKICSSQDFSYTGIENIINKIDSSNNFYKSEKVKFIFNNFFISSKSLKRFKFIEDAICLERKIDNFKRGSFEVNSKKEVKKKVSLFASYSFLRETLEKINNANENIDLIDFAIISSEINDIYNEFLEFEYREKYIDSIFNYFKNFLEIFSSYEKETDENKEILKEEKIKKLEEIITLCNDVLKKKE